MQARRVRKPFFGPKLSGVPEGLEMYRLVSADDDGPSIRV